jgi:FAD/FMN-containing dehydrogenase
MTIGTKPDTDRHLTDLRTLLRGPVLGPGDPGYEDSRTVWNAMIDRKPAIVARPLGTADVVNCVRFARERDLTLSIKGGGHNIAGLAVCDGGLLLDMSLQRGVWVDAASRVARAQAGCLLGDVDRETQLHGLAALMGFVSNTGIAGLTLGGGFGYLSRRFGWTCDTVRSIEMVTSEARIVRAGPGENPDLFWGLGGGGGNFGVVTGFEYELFPIGPEIIGGAIAWPGAAASEVLAMYRMMARTAGEDCAIVAAMRMAPPAPWLPKEIHGKLIVAFFICHTGPIADAERFLAPIKRFNAPAGDVVQKRTYISQQAILDATQPKGRRYYWKSEYLPDLDPALLTKFVDHAEKIVSPHSAVILFPLGGAIGRSPEGRNAMGNRDAAFVLNITASWEKPEDDRANIEWARTAWEDLREFSTGGTYINFLTAEEGDDRTRAAFRKSYDRLVEIKTKWDPENFFRMNKNLIPKK